MLPGPAGVTFSKQPSQQLSSAQLTEGPFSFLPQLPFKAPTVFCKHPSFLCSITASDRGLESRRGQKALVEHQGKMDSPALHQALLSSFFFQAGFFPSFWALRSWSGCRKKAGIDYASSVTVNSTHNTVPEHRELCSVHVPSYYLLYKNRAMCHMPCSPTSEHRSK